MTPGSCRAFQVGARSRNRSSRTMNQKELKELIDFLIEKDISEFELERGDVKVRIKRGADAAAPVIAHAAHMAPMPIASAAHPSAPSSASAVPATGAGSPAAAPVSAEEELH